MPAVGSVLAEAQLGAYTEEIGLDIMVVVLQWNLLNSVEVGAAVGTVLTAAAGRCDTRLATMMASSSRYGSSRTPRPVSSSTFQSFPTSRPLLRSLRWLGSDSKF